jgi:hypothetical protein
MNAVDDVDATIKRWRSAALTLAVGGLLLAAAFNWHPLALLIDTVMRWPNIAMGLCQVALITCAAGSCVAITTVASRHKPAATRRFVIAQCGIAAAVGALSLVMFFAAGKQYEMAPQEYLARNLASSWSLPLWLYLPLALTVTVVSWVGIRHSSR